MKKFFTIFFVSLGVIFFVILLALAYLWFADPFEIRPLLERYQSSATVTEKMVERDDFSAGTAPSGTAEVRTESSVQLTPAQADALSVVGIDPSAVPSTFSPEEIECFVGVLGAARVEEIKAGALPTPGEFFLAKECVD